MLQSSPYEMSDVAMLQYVLGPSGRDRARVGALLSTFGSFDEVVSAGTTRLSQSKLSASAINRLKVFEVAAIRMSRARCLNKPVLSSWTAVLDYLTARYARADIESFHAMFLDRKNVLIADEEMSRGTVDHAPVYPREIVKRALELNASALLLAHNHPSGDTTPSRNDIEMTREIVEACRALKIAVHDHIVVGRGGHASFKALGLL